MRGERERERAKEHYIAKAGRMIRGIVQKDEERGEGREGERRRLHNLRIKLFNVLLL
jgi:hypothetical protein